MGTGNYAGVTGMTLNPASIVDSRLKFDINLIGISNYYSNNYLSVKRDALVTGAFFKDKYKDWSLVQRDRSQTRLLGVLAPLIPPYWLGATPVEGMTCGTVRNLGPESGHIVAPRLVPGTESGRVRHGLIVYDGGRS